MINRISIIFHVAMTASVFAFVVAVNPTLAQHLAIGFDRLSLNLIEALYALKNMG